MDQLVDSCPHLDSVFHCTFPIEYDFHTNNSVCVSWLFILTSVVLPYKKVCDHFNGKSKHFPTRYKKINYLV